MLKIDETVICCGVIEAIMKEYSFPFDEPTRINMGTGEVDHTLGLVIYCFKKTHSGKVSQSIFNRRTILIYYCPFCGAKLDETEYAKLRRGEDVKRG